MATTNELLPNHAPTLEEQRPGIPAATPLAPGDAYSQRLLQAVKAEDEEPILKQEIV